MTLNQFLFSNKLSHRFTRHFVFWVVYFFYFYIQSLAPRKFDEFFIWETYYFAFLNLCCFGPVLIFAVYFFLYYLLPNTLKKKKYINFVSGFLLIYGLGTFVNYFTAEIFLSNVHYSTPIESNFQHRLEFGNYNTRWGMIIATIALGIKLSKDWWLQQQENLEILRKKAQTEIQIQKALFHPDLFIRSLNTIYTNIQSGSEKATALILHLSDLLSYSIYESGSKLISLEMELSGLHNLVALEKQQKKYSIEMLSPPEREIQGKLIAPVTIVKLFEESITLLDASDIVHSEITLDIAIASNNFTLDLTFNSLPEKALTSSKWLTLIENARNKLNEFYNKTDYQIKLITDKNKISIKLDLKLTGCPNEINVASKTKLTAADYDNA